LNTSEAIRKETITVVAAPNPFSNETTLSFTCQHEHIQLRILNSLGQEVEVLIDKTLSAGSHSITFDGKKLAAGSYYYQLKLENGQQKSGLLTRLR
jgi:endoglucanase